MHKHPSRTHEAYARLRDRITSGELKPGAVVSEASLAKDLGLSRTPIGEALRRLAHDGLVEQVPRYGTIVRHISRAELQELFEIREALEGMAAAKAAERINEVALVELDSLCEAIETELVRAEGAGLTRIEGESLSRFLAADMAFHLLIIASAGNRRLTELIENTRSISSIVNARRGEHSLERVRNAVGAHREILAALVERDSSAAKQRVIDHIRTSCQHSLLIHSSATAIRLDTINLPDSVRQALPSEA